MTLHATDAVALVEVWAGLKNYVPAKDQMSAAEQYIATIDDAGLVDLSIMSAELYGVCDTFDKALRTYCQENGLHDIDEALEDWDE